MLRLFLVQDKIKIGKIWLFIFWLRSSWWFVEVHDSITSSPWLLYFQVCYLSTSKLMGLGYWSYWNQQNVQNTSARSDAEVDRVQRAVQLKNRRCHNEGYLVLWFCVEVWDNSWVRWVRWLFWCHYNQLPRLHCFSYDCNRGKCKWCWTWNCSIL